MPRPERCNRPRASASTRAFGNDCGPAEASSIEASRSCSRPPWSASAARHSTASAPWPGRRHHDIGADQLGGLGEPAEPGQAAAATTTASSDRRRRPCRGGCRRCRATAGCRDRAGSPATARRAVASRCRPRHRPAGSPASADRARRARHARRRAAASRAMRSRCGGRGRQVLERVDGDIDVPSSNLVRSSATKTPTPPDSAMAVLAALLRSPCGGDADELDRRTAGRARQLGDRASPEPSRARSARAKPKHGRAARHRRRQRAHRVRSSPVDRGRRWPPAPPGRGRTAGATPRDTTCGPAVSASSCTRTVGACSTLSTTRRTVAAISLRAASSRSGRRRSRRCNSADTICAALSRNATTVGRDAGRPARGDVRGQLDVDDAACFADVVSGRRVLGDGGAAHRGRASVTPPSVAAEDRHRGATRCRARTAARSARLAIARSTTSAGRLAVGARAGDNDIGGGQLVLELGHRRRRDRRLGRPRRLCRQQSAAHDRADRRHRPPAARQRRSTPSSPRRRRSRGVRASPESAAPSRSPASTSVLPAASMPVSACARLAACRACSTT